MVAPHSACIIRGRIRTLGRPICLGSALCASVCLHIPESRQIRLFTFPLCAYPLICRCTASIGLVTWSRGILRWVCTWMRVISVWDPVEDGPCSGYTVMRIPIAPWCYIQSCDRIFVNNFYKDWRGSIGYLLLLRGLPCFIFDTFVQFKRNVCYLREGLITLARDSSTLQPLLEKTLLIYVH